MELQAMNQKEYASTKIYKVDIPKDHEGLSFGCNRALGDGETKNRAMDNKKPMITLRHTF